MPQAAEKRVIGRHACEHCRKSKIRCLTDTLESHGKCRKCYANNLDCAWKEISKTRNRKRTDARVADLERQLSILTASLNSGQGKDTPASAGCHEAQHESLLPFYQNLDLSSDKTRSTTAIDTPTLSNSPFTDRNGPNPQRSLEEILVSVRYDDFSNEIKVQLVKDFVAKLLPQYPVIAIPEDMPFEQLQTIKPFTTDAIIAATCSISKPELFKAMHNKNITILSQAVVIEGRKSIDLLQALLVTAVWASPPDNLSNLNIYQWSHMACTMALELGLGGKTSLQAQARSVNEFATNTSEAIMEEYRTMFGVYLTCSRLAISFRHQRTISFSSSTNAIIELFLQYSQTVNDRRLVAWLQLQSIAEDIESMKQNVESQRFRLTAAEVGDGRKDADTQPNSSQPGEVGSQGEVSVIQDRLRSWQNDLDPALWIESLRVDYGLCQSKLHELAIYFGQSIHQLDLPALTKRASNVIHDQDRLMSPSYIRALLSFINGCQSILDVFLQSSSERIRVLPMLTMFRIPFAFKALAMLRRRLKDPEDAITLVIDDQTLAWDHYSDSVSKILEAASSNGLYAYPAMALHIRDLMLKGQAADAQRSGSQMPQTADAVTNQKGIHDTRLQSSSAEKPSHVLNEVSDDQYNSLFVPLLFDDSENDVWSTSFMDFDLFSL